MPIPLTLYLALGWSVISAKAIVNEPQNEEPILRFPFVDFLANPCAATVNLSTGVTPAQVNHLPARERSLAMMHLTPLRSISENNFTTREILSPLHNAITGGHYNHTAVERESLLDELHLDILQATQLARSIYSPSMLHQCDGVHQLESISHESPLASSVVEIYRGLMISSAYLHLVLRDAFESGRHCLSDRFLQLYYIHQMAGKLESVSCLVLHLVSQDRLADFYPVVESFLQTTRLRRYYDCSAKRTRICLVMRYSSQLLTSIQNVF